MMPKDCRKRRLISLADENEEKNEKKSRTEAIIAVLDWESLPSDVWLFKIMVPFLGPLENDLVNLVQTNRFFHNLLSSFSTRTLYPKAHPVESSLVTFVRHIQHCHSVQHHYKTLCDLTLHYNSIVISIQNESDMTNITTECRPAPSDACDNTNDKITFQSQLQNESSVYDCTVSSGIPTSVSFDSDADMFSNTLDDTILSEEDKEISANNIKQQDRSINFDLALDLALHLLLEVNLSQCSKPLQSKVLSICGKCGGIVYKLLRTLSNNSNTDKISLQKAQWIMQLVVAKRLQQKLQSHLIW